MSWILPLVGIVFSFYLVYKRQMFGDMIGEADWMLKVGGVYNFIVIVGIFIFFWSISELFGTTNILFAPLTWVIPGMGPQ